MSIRRRLIDLAKAQPGPLVGALIMILESIRATVRARNLSPRYTLVKGHNITLGNIRVDKAAALEAQCCRLAVMRA